MPKSRPSSLLEAAERFDRLVKVVKDNQYAAAGATPPEAEEIDVLHPEEAWARRFATHTFQPHGAGRDDAFPFQGFLMPPVDRPVQPIPPVSPRPSPDSRAGSHIGAGLGKAGPRRSWLARLVGGR
jgi:hypothetical protein